MYQKNRWKIETISLPNGSMIRYGVYTQTNCPECWIVFANGREEWIEKYQTLPKEICLKKNIGFLTWDHRGQGGSSGKRSHIEDIDFYVEDGSELLNIVVGSAPFVLIGHSMGGLIALCAVLKNRVFPRHLILLSPLLQMRNKPLNRKVAKSLASLLSLFYLGKLHCGVGSHDCSFDNNPYTHDFDSFQKIQSSPYKLPSPTFSWIRAIFKAIDYISSEKNISHANIPIDIFTAQNETIVEKNGAKEWATKACKLEKKISLKEMKGARHELLKESPKIKDLLLNDLRHLIDQSFQKV